MSEETRMLKEILDNADLDNYAIDDDECYLSGYARKCLKKVLDQLQQKDNIIKKNQFIFKALHKNFSEHEEYEYNEFLRQLESCTDNDMVWLKRMAGESDE